MHSISPQGEWILSILATFAEGEAKSASDNQKWRIKKRFEKGEPWVGHMLGYRLSDGKLTIVPEEAETVRWIFAEYLSGSGIGSIAKSLTMRGIVSPTGGKWAEETIRSILVNEKYTGGMLLQKTYRPDFRTKKTKINHGEVRMYRVEESHEAIIDEVTFGAVQDEIKRRRQIYYQTNKPKIDQTKQRQEEDYRLFRGLIRCRNCGRAYKYYRVKNRKSNDGVWVCPNYNNMGKNICPSQRIPEDILVAKTKDALLVDTLTRKVIEEKLQMIEAPEHNLLVFTLKNGVEVHSPWQPNSRRGSWTPEMRQAAREKAIEQRRKEREKNAESDDH